MTAADEVDEVDGDAAVSSFVSNMLSFDIRAPTLGCFINYVIVRLAHALYDNNNILCTIERRKR